MSMIKKHSWWRFLSRFALWSHVVGVIGFYAVIWWRTAPNKEDRVRKLPVRQSSVGQSEGLAGKSGEEVARMSAAALSGAMVSVIVPARNEEQNIRRCVQSLLEQDYEWYEVIAVDDASTDATYEILDELARTHPNGKRLRIVRLDGLPEGWAGKPHAIHSGTQEARGEWLLLTDADTWHAPNALHSALTQAQAEQMDMFTISSTQILPTFWEKVAMPIAFLGISMQYPPKLVNDPLSPVAVANGQFILLRRDVYDAIGGYARPELRNTLLDDRDLAHVVKENGFKLHFVDGRDLVYVRMYKSLADLWRGWRKNSYLGSRGGLAFVLLQLFGLPMISVVPFLLPLLAWLTRTKRGEGISATEANVATALELVPLLAYRAWLDRQIKVPWYYAFTHALGGAIFEGILAQSTWRVLTGKGVDWRGRSYHKK